MRVRLVKGSLFVFLSIFTVSIPAQAQHAKNIILILGDGAGLTSLNAASLYGYGAPQSLYLQHMPNIAWVDTSSASEWVTDASACATAYATGVKTNNTVVSETPTAKPGVEEGQKLKTILEYAEEHGLSTGVISNSGSTDGIIAAFYAHNKDRGALGEIFDEILTPRFGDGIDLVVGPDLKTVLAETSKLGHDIGHELPEHGYAFLDSVDGLDSLHGKSRAVVLTDDTEFDLGKAVSDAVKLLSSNPKGYFLVVHSDTHIPDAKKSLSRLVELDKITQATVDEVGAKTLVFFTADHSYGLYLSRHKEKEPKSRNILPMVTLDNDHTAEEVPLFATGPGSSQVKGFISNTDVFHFMLDAYGWDK
jgi:alkaline phosphatase